MVTPNGDGFNDHLEVRFILLKVETQPEVEIFSLNGQRVGVFREVDDGDNVHIWNGRNQMGNLVPPGAYICRRRVPADAGDEVMHRIITVAY